MTHPGGIVPHLGMVFFTRNGQFLGFVFVAWLLQCSLLEGSRSLSLFLSFTLHFFLSFSCIALSWTVILSLSSSFISLSLSSSLLVSLSSRLCLFLSLSLHLSWFFSISLLQWSLLEVFFSLSLCLFSFLALHLSPQRLHLSPRVSTHTYTNTCTGMPTYMRTATYCNTLKQVATHCNTLQHTATHCNTLQHTATHCNALKQIVTLCNTIYQTGTYTQARCVCTHMGWLRLVGSKKHRSLLQKSPIKVTIFCKREL